MSDQQKMEAYVEKTMEENNIKQRDTLNGMMKSENLGCSFEERTITFGFPVQQWQANRVGVMHGGAICTAFDLTIAAVARFFARKNFAPTVSLDMKYIRPAQLGDTLIVTAKAIACGNRISHFTCEAVSRESGKLIASGTSVYLNIDTSS